MGFIFQENEKSREEVMERIQKDLGDRLQMSREELGAIKNQMKGENTNVRIGRGGPTHDMSAPYGKGRKHELCIRNPNQW